MAITPDILHSIADREIIRRGRNYYNEGRVILSGYGETTVYARVRGSRWYNVVVHDGEEAGGSCSCRYAGGTCKHVVAVMFAIMEGNTKPVKTTANIFSLLQGIPQKIQVPKEPSWTDEVRSLLTDRPADYQRPVAPAQPPRPWRLVYSLLISDGERQIVPLRIKQLKNGRDAVPTYLKQFDPRDKLHFDLADRVIISRLQQYFHSYVETDKSERSQYADYGYGRPQQTPAHDWDDVLHLLTNKEFYAQVNGNLLGKRIFTRTELARFRVAASESDLGIALQPEIERNGSWQLLPKEVVIITNNPLWVLHRDEVFRIDGAFGDEVMAFKRRKMRIAIPSAGRKEFVKKLLPPLLSRYNVRSELERVRTVHADPVPRIYLAERNSNLTVELRFAYDDIEVKSLPEAIYTIRDESRVFNVGDEIVHLNRKRDMEETYRTLLLTFSLERDKTQAKHIIYLPVISSLDWVMMVLPRLQEAGFHTFGQDDLQAHKLRRDAPTMKFDISSGIDWFDLSVDVKFAGTDASLEEFVKAVINKSRYVRLEDGSFGVLPEEWMERAARTIDMLEQTENGLRFSRIHVSVVDDLLEGVDNVTVDEAFDSLRKKFQTFKQIEPVTIPGAFRGELRPYQKAGYDWLHFLREFGIGGILADDMGLGKTVQTLAMLQRCYEAGESLPSLIVVPSSPLFNWKREAERFTPTLKVLVHTGLNRHEHIGSLETYNIILTSYGILRRDIGTLKAREFLYVVLDESQNIKNPASVNAKAARLLRARHRLALSGTPIENNLVELWSQFAFLNPGMLGAQSAFSTHFARPIERQKNETVSTSLKRIIFPFILRRTKEIVASELPAKTETVTYCDMDPAQRTAYDHWREYYRRAIQRSIDSVGFARSKIKVLEGLMKLRQVCCHPLLVDAKYAGSSGKFDAFVEMVDDILSEGHKVLVFSQFVKLLSILRKHFDSNGIAYEYLDGSTRDRQERVDHFQNDDRIKLFLISLKAGGTGLNLTAADYVIHYDPWWNPAVETQATDRTHRIGQTRRVFAYKLITRESVEEKVLALQEKKKELVKNIISTDSGFVKSLTREDVERLFS